MSEIDPIYRLPRIWSNMQLRHIAHVFNGNAINVSGYKDQDKEGKFYKEYFTNVKDYFISNFNSENRGLTGNEFELEIDLREPLKNSLKKQFDVVFNHTVLEHVFEIDIAFKNLCDMSKDAVIIVVPFLQEMHAHGMGDYWRFTPMAIKKLFEKNGFNLQYCSFNEHTSASVYLFAIGLKPQSKYEGLIEKKISYTGRKVRGKTNTQVGVAAIPITKQNVLKSFFKRLIDV